MSGSECVVWWARLGSLTDRHLALLDHTEHGRRQAYLREADRERFALGAAVVKLAVAELTGAAPERVRIDRTCPDCSRPHGRPQVVAGATGTVRDDVHVSVSHSGEFVAVAISTAAPVGVDVEQVSDRDLAAVARTVLGPEEAIGEPAEFFVTWTRKESAVKATGDGLRVPLQEVVVSRPAEPARLVSYPGLPGLAASMVDLHPPDPPSPPASPGPPSSPGPPDAPGPPGLPSAAPHRAALTTLTATQPAVRERDAADLAR